MNDTLLLSNPTVMTDPSFLANLGSRIKKIRMEKNVSQFQLASLCDFEKASMSRIESGKTNTTILTLQKISKALNVHVSELLKES